MKLEDYYRKKAKEIHHAGPVVDTHLDLAGELVYRLRNGEENPLRDIYLPSFRKGGFDLIVSSIYLQNHELPEGGLRAALEQIVVLKDHLIGIILYMEGLDEEAVRKIVGENFVQYFRKMLPKTS